MYKCTSRLSNPEDSWIHYLRFGRECRFSKVTYNTQSKHTNYFTKYFKNMAKSLKHSPIGLIYIGDNIHSGPSLQSQRIYCIKALLLIASTRVPNYEWNYCVLNFWSVIVSVTLWSNGGSILSQGWKRYFEFAGTANACGMWICWNKRC